MWSGNATIARNQENESTDHQATGVTSQKKNGQRVSGNLQGSELAGGRADREAGGRLDRQVEGNSDNLEESHYVYTRRLVTDTQWD